MIEFFINIDISLFYFVNHDLANPFFDKLMPFITEVNSWILLYLVGIVWLIWKGGTKGRIAALALILTLGLTDFINSEILKELFDRARPCREMIDARLLVNCGPGKSFPSSHAANNFAAATVLSYFFRSRWWIFYPAAFLVAFSRIYIGVHYPADTIGGAIVGFAIASIVLAIIYQLFRKYL